MKKQINLEALKRGKDYALIPIELIDDITTQENAIHVVLHAPVEKDSPYMTFVDSHFFKTWGDKL